MTRDEFGKGGRTILVVAPTEPKFSEVWMEEMNISLGDSVIFIALSGAEKIVDWSENDIVPKNMVLLGENKMPRKLQIHLKSNELNSEIETIVKRVSETSSVVILMHYLTTAVILKRFVEKCRVPILVHCHGHDVTWNRRVEKLPFLKAHGRGYKAKVYDLSRKLNFIANSEATKEKLLDVPIPEDNIFVKYLCVTLPKDIPQFNASKEVTILYLGRLVDFKGPIETIEAFEIACELGLLGNLIVAGAGVLENECAQLVKKSKWQDRIDLCGKVNKIKAQQLLSKADIFTAHNKTSEKTGQQEGLGVSVLEAMANATPVVTGADGGVVETVIDGKTGLLFEPGDIAGHAKSLLMLSKSPQLRKKMGLEGRLRVETSFNVNNEPKLFDDIFGVIEGRVRA